VKTLKTLITVKAVLFLTKIERLYSLNKTFLLAVGTKKFFFSEIESSGCMHISGKRLAVTDLSV